MNGINANFHFCDSCDAQQQSTNKALIKRVIKTYQQEGVELEKELRVLFFFAFNGRSIQYPGEFGFVVTRESHEYSNFKKENADELGIIKDFSSYGYIVYVSRILAEDEGEISRVLTMAHEVRHVIQDVTLEKSHLKDVVLKKFLRMRCANYFNEIYRNIPAEIDAFRESKKTAIKIFGEREAEAFFDEKIIQHRNEMLRTLPGSQGQNDEIAWLSYWEHIKSMNIERFYDFSGKFKNLWFRYVPIIEKEVGQIRRKQEDGPIDPEEEGLLEAYDFLISRVTI